MSKSVNKSLKGNWTKDGVLVKSALANSAMWVNKWDTAYSSLPEYFIWTGSHSNALPFVNAHHLHDSHNASQALYIPECLCTKVHVVVPTSPAAVAGTLPITPPFLSQGRRQIICNYSEAVPLELTPQGEWEAHSHHLGFCKYNIKLRCLYWFL